MEVVKAPPPVSAHPVLHQARIPAPHSGHCIQSALHTLTLDEQHIWRAAWRHVKVARRDLLNDMT